MATTDTDSHTDSTTNGPHKASGDGRAYGRSPGTADLGLTQVGLGTPSGELLRRYWHPVAMSDEATSVPSEVRLLGEDLILYRALDKKMAT